MSLLPSAAGRARRFAAWIPILATAPAAAGVVFREVEIAEPGASAASSREVRQVSAQGDSCRILQEESGDPAAPAGSYILVTPNDAFIVDPARSTIAPVAPTAMQPVSQTADAPVPAIQVTDVALERQLEEPGPALLGLPTRHYVYRLRYREEKPPQDSRKAVTVNHEERHEFWATAWPAGGEGLGTWRAWRVAEDAGAAAERREVRDAVDELYEHGFFLRQVIERRESTGTAPAAGAPVAKLSREVTAIRQESIPGTAFERPAGFSLSEYLAPSADDADDSSPAPVAEPAPPGPS